jgi:hypothetical protein
MRAIVCLLALAMGQTILWGADWPTVSTVEPQPLLAQVQRLDQALSFLGQPLPEEARKILAGLKPSDGDKAVAEVQRLLDGRCLAAVETGPEGVSKVTAGTRPVELVEQGWRACLVKVVNRAGATGMLRADSPSAQPVPNGPKDKVAERWMMLMPHTAQPLLPNLSGLGLEYTVLQVYSRDAGDRNAVLDFRLEGGQGAGKAFLAREWDFTKGPDGWVAENQSELDAKTGKLIVKSLGEDPFITAPVVTPRGKLSLRFWANFEKGGMAQIFWWTRSRRYPDGGHQKSIQIEPGAGKEYVVDFTAEDELAGIRIDPGSEKGLIQFDWIRLSREDKPAGPHSRAEITFQARPSVPVTFKVAEFDGTPCTAAFLIRDKEGRVYPAQAKRLAPDFFFHPQVYRATGETVRLPAGKYAVLCSRGPESIPEAKELVVADQPVTFSYTVQRWIDPSAQGWWSGDHHIHAAGCLHYENPSEGVEPSDMMRHVLGEDLKVGCCLTWGPCFDYQKRFFTGKPDNVSKYPYLLRYDVEVSGFGSHASGHLNLLKLKEQIYPGGDSKKHWPTLGMNTLRWAKKQGGITGPAHSANGLTRFVGRIGETQDGPHGLPNFNIPAYDGIGANEYIVDATHTVPGPDGKPVPALDFISAMDTDRVAEWNMWYHTLNCGYRIRVSGETDFPCISGDRVGMGRVYVKVPGKLDFDQWVDGIQSGKSYVSDGTTHLMDFTARTPEGKTLEVGEQGSQVRLDKPGQMLFTAQVAAYQPGKKSVPVELVVNGQVLNTVEIPADGSVQKLAISAPIQKSSWVALRVFPSAHSNPFFVLVNDKPIRASKDSAKWCLAGVDQCWKMKEKTYAQTEQEQARADYAHARREYQRILEECDR